MPRAMPHPQACTDHGQRSFQSLCFLQSEERAQGWHQSLSTVVGLWEPLLWIHPMCERDESQKGSTGITYWKLWLKWRGKEVPSSWFQTLVSIQLQLESRDAHDQHLDLGELNSYQQSLNSKGFAYIKKRSMHCQSQGFGRVKSA